MEVIIIIIFAILAIIIANVKIVPQAHEHVVEFLGKYKTTWSAGIHIKIPVIERIAKKSNP